MIRNVHLRTYPVSRAKNQSAVAGAAYRAGQKLTERARPGQTEERVHRFNNRGIDVREAFILLPEGAPDWAGHREELWNQVEAYETRKNARVGREVQVGLAYELSHDDQRKLAVEFAQKEFIAKGFAVDVAIHNYGHRIPSMGASETQRDKLREWAQNGVPFLTAEQARGREDLHVLELQGRDGTVTGYKLYQPHVHFRVTPRTFEDGHFSKDKYPSRELNKHETAMNWRYDWPKLQNEYLARAGVDVEVTCTSPEEDEFPSIRRDGSKESRALHEIEQRADQLSEDKRAQHQEAKECIEADRAFTEALNGALQEAATPPEPPAPQDDPATERFERQYRLTGFFRNMSQRLNHLKEQVPEVAREWRARFDGAQERLRSWFGYQHKPEDHSEPETISPPIEPDTEPRL